MGLLKGDHPSFTFESYGSRSRACAVYLSPRSTLLHLAANHSTSHPGFFSSTWIGKLIGRSIHSSPSRCPCLVSVPVRHKRPPARFVPIDMGRRQGTAANSGRRSGEPSGGTPTHRALTPMPTLTSTGITTRRTTTFNAGHTGLPIENQTTYVIRSEALQCSRRL